MACSSRWLGSGDGRIRVVLEGISLVGDTHFHIFLALFFTRVPVLDRPSACLASIRSSCSSPPSSNLS